MLKGKVAVALMLFYLAFKNIVSRKSSYVIVAFISFAIALIAVVNSLFDSSENGIEQTFSRTFTGDIAIFPESETGLSLFGDETPVTGTLTELESLVPFDEITAYLESLPEVENFVPQVTGACMLDLGKDKEPLFVFGIPAWHYFECMSSLAVTEGELFGEGKRGVLLSRAKADEIGAKLGDEIQFIVADGNTARIRSAPLRAIYEYPVENETLEKIVLADAFTVRSLMDIAEFITDDDAIEQDKIDFLGDEFDEEAMFDDAQDVDAIFSEEDFASEDFSVGDEPCGVQETQEYSVSSWNFLVCCLRDGEVPKRTIKKLNAFFDEHSWPVRAVGWRAAAGNSALYLYWMRFILNVGIAVILVAGFIVINNTLLITILNRTQQIGTLRAEGASRAFVSLQCMVETFTLTVVSGVVGCTVGAICNLALTEAKIELSNEFLRQLFGSDVLSIYTSASALAKSMVLSLALGLLTWIYPLKTALAVSPVQAMQGSL